MSERAKGDLDAIFSAHNAMNEADRFFEPTS